MRSGLQMEIWTLPCGTGLWIVLHQIIQATNKNVFFPSLSYQLYNVTVYRVGIYQELAASWD